MDGRGDVGLDGDRRTRGGLTGRRDQEGVREIGYVQNLPVKCPVKRETKPASVTLSAEIE